MGDSNTPISSGVSVHHHSNSSVQGGALKSDLTVIESPDGSGNYVSLEALF
ncbi:MAG: hypothetical protein P8L91_02830 [Candidatus Marinimicrobia bacterium]|nr:hypothetical protein [Candidatus Neomarinimicrobiota bacterium]